MIKNCIFFFSIGNEITILNERKSHEIFLKNVTDQLLLNFMFHVIYLNPIGTHVTIKFEIKIIMMESLKFPSLVK